MYRLTQWIGTDQKVNEGDRLIQAHQDVPGMQVMMCGAYTPENIGQGPNDPVHQAPLLRDAERVRPIRKITGQILGATTDIITDTANVRPPSPMDLKQHQLMNHWQ